MKKIVPIIFLFGSEFFFTSYSILGLNYAGKESSKAFVVYNILLSTLMLLICIEDFLSDNKYFSKIQVLLFCIPFIYLFLFFISVILGNVSDISLLRFEYFLLWSMPAIYLGIYMSKDSRIKILIKSLDVIMIVFTLGVTISMLIALISGNKVSVGGGNYQSASYISALAFGINIYFLFCDHKYERFLFTEKKLYRLISFILLPLQLLSAITAGGRGAMVLIIVYVFFVVRQIFNSKYGWKFIINSALKIVIFVLIVFFLLIYLNKNERLVLSLSRVFSYVSKEGIVWSATSERSDIYSDVILLIMNSPIIGYGIYNVWNVYPRYAHNIFLEILMQGGMLLIFLFSLAFLKISTKIKKAIKFNSQYNIILLVSFYPMVMLLFSGTYMNNILFWFIISFIMSLKLGKTEQSD